MQAISGRCDADLARSVIRNKIAELRERAERIGNVVAFLEDAVDKR
jgi:hypothetical protein